MSVLPGGTVVFLFTDIEGCTRLWEQYPEQMQGVLARHDTLLRKAIEGHNGLVFKTLGDGFCAVFARVLDALEAALTAEVALLAETWEMEAPLRVRMALHAGEAELREGDYFGQPLNRVARLLAVANGGQIVLSLAAEEMARDLLPEGMSLRELGSHRLRDLMRPEQVFQLVHPALPADFPPLRSLDNSEFRNNLPRQLTSFIGRETEMAEVKQLLSRTRFLTLTGAGGCGKTRLFLQVAADLLEEYPDGVWLVELASLSEPSLVPETIAAALNVHEQAGKPIALTLTEALHARKMLLVLDNCEHLLNACAQMADALLRSCPHIKLLTTSRQGLGIAGEQTYRVPSLSLPDPALPLVLDRLHQYESVRLFLERAVYHHSTFTLTPQNMTAVVSICTHLDGIPLALELAAARVGALSVEEINRRLNDRFHLLTGGNRAAIPRHRTLRALIDWSYDLLDEREKILLNRLSVFAGGWTLDAAERVCPGANGGADVMLDEWDMLDLLTSLFDKSLVVADISEKATRYHLLETVREYAAEHLTQSGESEELHRKHRDYFLALAEEANPKLQGPEQQTWMERLEIEHDNLRAAIAWSQPREGEAEAEMRLAAALHRFWDVRGYWSEGRRHLEKAAAREESQQPTFARAQALGVIGWLAYRQGDYAVTRDYCEQALAINRTVGNRHGEAFNLNTLGLVAQAQGDSAVARACQEQALAINRATGNRIGEAFNLNHLGMMAQEEGDYTTARACYEQALALSRAIGNRTGEAFNLNNLGLLAKELGDYETAHNCLDQALTINREMGNRAGEAHNLSALGRIAASQAEMERARFLQVKSLRIRQQLGSVPQIAESLEAFATLATLQGQATTAVLLFGAAEALRESIGTSLLSNERGEYENHMAILRSALAPSVFAETWAIGRATTLKQVVNYALNEEVLSAISEHLPAG